MATELSESALDEPVEPEDEQRDPEDTQVCPECEGSGKVDGATCPTCDGTGTVDPDEMVGGVEQDSADRDLEKRKRVAESIDGTIERRDFTAQELGIRGTSDGGLRFTGYASTTEMPYEVADFTETIARGAFKRTLGQNPDVVLLINHEGLPLARTKSGTLTLNEDSRGLRVDADLDPEDPDVRSLLPKMRRGDLTEMSFAFRATQQDWDEEYTKRTIREVMIDKGDVSMVTHGTNTATTGTVTMRSADGELELRVGKSISTAKEIKLKAAKEAIEEVLGLPDEEPVATPADPLAVIIPSGVESERARRARAIRRDA